MINNDLKLLDCTLRDGGYVNNWNWGFQKARSIIRFLSKAKIDFVEVGFLRNTDEYNENITVCNTIEELNRLLPDEMNSEVIYSAMAMRSNYDISKLTPYSGKGIELIRITAHDYDLEEGLRFAKRVKDLGYKLSINPINIMGYSDEKILWIIEQINRIEPYQFAIVDTFGSMKRRDLDRIVSLVDNNLNKNVRLSLHLHENMSLSNYLAQKFIDKHLKRPIAIDGSLMGMGRIPGNLPIELISDYCNEYCDKNYDIDYLMDAIHNYISPLKGHSEWGYTPEYFLSAKFNLHRNYAEHYIKKGDLSTKDICKILAMFERSKATVFDSKYADRLYESYKNSIIDDSLSRSELKLLLNKDILILAPGSSLHDRKKDILRYIDEFQPIIISVNFIPSEFDVDFAFFSNSKRFEQSLDKKCKLITTSNIHTDKDSFCLNYNSLSSSFEQGYNSYIMLLNLLSSLDISDVAVAGADGFIDNSSSNYYNDYLKTSAINGTTYNLAVQKAVSRIGINVNYITDSRYK